MIPRKYKKEPLWVHIALAFFIIMATIGFFLLIIAPVLLGVFFNNHSWAWGLIITVPVAIGIVTKILEG